MFVTIAIPFYNAEKYLSDSIKSVFAQTHQDWELILIDDGSTDGSLNIAKSIDDSRVRVFSDGKNKKLASRLNEVTQLARYDYIARMDADDLMSPDRIKTQIDILKENPNLDLVSTGVFSVKNDLSLVGIRGADYINIDFDGLIRKKTGIVHAAVVAKKDWYKRNKYDESLSIAQDIDLWLRATKNNDLIALTINNPLYVYREEDNVTANKMLRALRNERNMYSKFVDNQILKYKLLTVSYIKSFIINIFDKIDLIKFLQKSRNRKAITNTDFQEYNNIIAKIKNTNVKGLL
jgi:glycosyltransferase involved in cell wall biosynthesis